MHPFTAGGHSTRRDRSWLSDRIGGRLASTARAQPSPAPPAHGRRPNHPVCSCHHARQGGRTNSVVRAMSIMYVRCTSDLGHPEWWYITLFRAPLEHADGPADACGKCASPRISTRSRSSRRRVPTRRSQVAFMRGVWTAVRRILAPVAWKTASNEAVKFDPRSRMRNLMSSNRSPRERERERERERLRACWVVHRPVGWR
jgi:hypothetical protein